MKTTKTIIIYLLLLVLLIAVNNYYFEYCVSRDMETWMSIGISLVVAAFDIWALTMLVHKLKEALKID